VAGAQSREFEDRIITAIEKAEVAHELPPLSTNSKRTLFLRLQKLREKLEFIDDPRGWLDSSEKRQEAARSRVVKGPVGEVDPVDMLTLQDIHNEQELHAVLDSRNAPETIDLIGRAATGKLLLDAFKLTVEVYFATWSKTLDSHYENFGESVGIIKSLVIAECRAFWLGRLLAPSEMNPPANEELPWFDRFPLADVDAELGDEADRWINQVREEELRLRQRAEATVESVSSEPTAMSAAAATEVLSAKSADKPKPRRRRQKQSRQLKKEAARDNEPSPTHRRNN
jgi:hypothetical protein